MRRNWLQPCTEVWRLLWFGPGQEDRIDVDRRCWWSDVAGRDTDCTQEKLWLCVHVREKKRIHDPSQGRPKVDGGIFCGIVRPILSMWSTGLIRDKKRARTVRNMTPQRRLHTIQRSARMHTNPVPLCFLFCVLVRYGGFVRLSLTRCRCSSRRCWWLSPRLCMQARHISRHGQASGKRPEHGT